MKAQTVCYFSPPIQESDNEGILFKPHCVLSSAMVCSGVTHEIGQDTPDRSQQCKD